MRNISVASLTDYTVLWKGAFHISTGCNRLWFTTLYSKCHLWKRQIMCKSLDCAIMSNYVEDSTIRHAHKRTILLFLLYDIQMTFLLQNVMRNIRTHEKSNTYVITPCFGMHWRRKLTNSFASRFSCTSSALYTTVTYLYSVVPHYFHISYTDICWFDDQNRANWSTYWLINKPLSIFYIHFLWSCLLTTSLYHLTSDHNTSGLHTLPTSLIPLG